MPRFNVRPYEAFSREDWPDLVSRIGSLVRAHAAEQPVPTLWVSSTGSDLVDAVVARGAAAAGDLAGLAPLVNEALTERAREGAEQASKGIWEGLSIDVLGIVDCFGALAAVGIPLPEATWAAARQVLEYIATSRPGHETGPLGPHYHWHRGLAGLALDVPEVSRSIAGLRLRENPAPFTPGETPGPNVQGFIRHLTGAIDHGAPIEDVMPAFHERLDRYTDDRQMDLFYTPCLFWTGWILCHRVTGQPVDTVADWVHSTLYRAAGAEPGVEEPENSRWG